jgi:hypothetical protein
MTEQSSSFITLARRALHVYLRTGTYVLLETNGTDRSDNNIFVIFRLALLEI